ncbi:hypothetical protein NMY22_g17867 [Coprinellus aureogranulatus]|nr:hypothetical protein NMY22_g17867 [Coprinellus aureogranulatus]
MPALLSEHLGATAVLTRHSALPLPIPPQILYYAPFEPELCIIFFNSRAFLLSVLFDQVVFTMSPSELAPSSAQSGVKATSPKDKAQSRKKKAPRRRARARGNFESDDEIEREVATSESEDDDDDDRSSSSDSATDDSDTEPGSEDVPSNIQTPAVGKDVAVEGVAHINGAVAPFFESSLTWSEMRGLQDPSWSYEEIAQTKNKKAAVSTPPAPDAQETEPVDEEAPAVASGAMPINHQVIYHLQDALNLLPDLRDQTITQSFAASTNDQMLVVYLSSLVRSVIALHALVDNKASIGRAELEEQDGLREKGSGSGATTPKKDSEGKKA